MIAFLKGTMAGRSADTAFVDVNGVGFAVYMPATDIVKLPRRAPMWRCSRTLPCAKMP